MIRKITHIISVVLLALSSVAPGLLYAETTQSLPIREQVYTLSQSDFFCSISECTSREVETDFAFQNTAFEWRGDAHINARFFEKGIWSTWYDVEGEVDAPDSDVAPVNTQLLVTSGSRRLQIKTQNPAPALITIRVFNVAPAPTPVKGDFSISANETPSNLNLVARAQWLSGIELPWQQRSEGWPFEYDTAKKIIIHHTVTNTSDFNGDGVINSADYQQVARGIYSYHAKSRQWGDVGYNYLIDPTGTIWEGREGGDGVVAGHAFRDNSCKKFTSGNIGFNRGTIGIALIGNYTGDTLTPQARASLTSLIAKKSWEFGFDPAGSSFFKDQIYPNVMGHRDVDCTECPGNNVYNEFAGIIAESKLKFDELTVTTPKKASAEIVSVSPSVVDIRPGEEKTVTITAKNTGTVAWRNYGETPVQIALASAKESLASLESVAIASEGKDQSNATTSNSTSSLAVATLRDANVAPGQTGTFTVTIKDAPTELISKKKFVMSLGRLGWFSGSDISVTIFNNGLPLAGLLDESKLPTRILDETKTPITLSFQNKGTEEWKKGDVKLAVTDKGKKTSSLKDASWKKTDGQFDFQEKTVKPGETATFKISLYGKNLGGATQVVALYNKKEKIAGTDYYPLNLTVNPGYAAEIISHSVPSVVQVGWQPSVAITVKNTGSLPWDKASLMAYAKNGTSTSAFRAPSWKSATVIDRTDKVLPGETVTFLFKLKSPAKPGSYEQQFVLKQGTKTMYVGVADEKPKKSLPITIRVDKSTPKKK